MSEPAVDVRRRSAPDGSGAPALLVTAANRGDRPLCLSACVLVTLSGIRLYLEPHLDYPVTLRTGERCTEWIPMSELCAALRARGYEGHTEIIPLYLERLDRRARLISMMLSRGSNIDVRGIEHRGRTFVLDVGRPAPG
jgi:hypothetical protein